MKYITLSVDSKDLLEIIKVWNVENKKNKFWGFNKTDSGTNFDVDSLAGRLNETGQHHLYAAFDIDTAISEIRPVINQNVSIATIKTLEKLKLFDLTKVFDGSEIDDFCNVDVSFIADKFSIPNYNDDNFYKPTQILSNYIKKNKFDGIIYPSSVNKNGKNILIFDNKNIEYEKDRYNATYKILSSKIYCITATKIQKKLILTFK